MTEDQETISVYNKNIEQYKKLVATTNLDNNLELFLKMLKSKAVVLDVGCGIGQVSSKLQELGHVVYPVDASLEMVRVARTEFQVNASQRTFDQIDEVDFFEGIWANFSLLHTKKKYFVKNLEKLLMALKNNGVFFFSLKSGNGENRDSLGRYYSYYSEEEVQEILNKVGFVVTKQTNGEDKGLTGAIEKWMGFFCINSTIVLLLAIITSLFLRPEKIICGIFEKFVALSICNFPI